MRLVIPESPFAVGADVAQEMRATGDIEVDPFSNRPGVYVRSPENPPA